MQKYVVYRLLGKLKEFSVLSTDDHELVAVEYGSDIYEATDKLIQAVNADASGLEKYRIGYTVSTDAPQREERGIYAYSMVAVVEPAYGERNDLVFYGVTEEAGNEL